MRVEHGIFRRLGKNLPFAARAAVAPHADWKEFARRCRPALAEEFEAIARDPNTHIVAGDRAMARDSYSLAMECFSRALEYDPNNIPAMQGLATAMVASEKFDLAKPVYQQLIGLCADDPNGNLQQPGVVARFNYAVALSRLQEFDEATRVYQEVLAAHHNYVEAWYNLAGLHYTRGRLADARDAWKQVTAMCPNLASAHMQLGEVLLDMGDSHEAVKEYSLATQLTPQDAGAWLNLATASHAAGELGRALGAAKQAAKLAPENPVAWASQGDILLEIHRATGERKFLEQAVTAWRECLRLDPQQKKIQELLATYGLLDAASRPVSSTPGK